MSGSGAGAGEAMARVARAAETRMEKRMVSYLVDVCGFGLVDGGWFRGGFWMLIDFDGEVLGADDDEKKKRAVEECLYIFVSLRIVSHLSSDTFVRI